jgi:SAM-dependent methyltransferase
MAGWGDGYVTDVPYVSGYHTETVPVWISTAATLLGYSVPDVRGPIRYADLGCGRGVTALVVAATMPQAEVWAIDFNPAHIGSGRDIARRAGLTNIQFVEASFDKLIHDPPAGLDSVDYASAHGVVSWVSLENRRRLVKAIGRILAPSGVAFVSYNVATGWNGMRPIHTLMRLLADASPERTDLALPGIFRLLEEMKTAGAAMFIDHPTLHDGLTRLGTADARYVVHELLNRDWHPIMFPAIAAEMADIKCDYIGSATLQDNFGGLSVPAGLMEIMSQIHDANLRESMRDVAAATAFRRDLYQRGARRKSPVDHRASVDAIRLVRTFRPVADPFTVPSPLGPLNADPVRFAALLEILENGPTTIGALRAHERLRDWPEIGFMEAVALLAGGGYLAPALPAPPGDAAMRAAARLNAVHAELFAQGYPQLYLAYPGLGGAWQDDGIGMLILDELSAGRRADESSLVDALMQRISGGQSLQANGQLATEAGLVKDKIAGAVHDFFRHLPAMRELGLIGERHGASG